jgi:hypothetical protein
LDVAYVTDFPTALWNKTTTESVQWQGQTYQYEDSPQLRKPTISCAFFISWGCRNICE